MNKSSQETYQVEKIVSVKRIHDKNYYLVKWIGYPADQSTWEPIEHLRRVLPLIRNFHRDVGAGLEKAETKRVRRTGIRRIKHLVRLKKYSLTRRNTGSKEVKKITGLEQQQQQPVNQPENSQKVVLTVEQDEEQIADKDQKKKQYEKSEADEVQCEPVKMRIRVKLQSGNGVMEKPPAITVVAEPPTEKKAKQPTKKVKAIQKVESKQEGQDLEDFIIRIPVISPTGPSSQAIGSQSQPKRVVGFVDKCTLKVQGADGRIYTQGLEWLVQKHPGILASFYQTLLFGKSYQPIIE